MSCIEWRKHGTLSPNHIDTQKQANASARQSSTGCAFASQRSRQIDDSRWSDMGMVEHGESSHIALASTCRLIFVVFQSSIPADHPCTSANHRSNKAS